MMHIILGIFLILHGGVHLLYLGQSAGTFELQPGLAWPAGSWLLDHWMTERAIRMTADISLALCTALFAIAGIGRLLDRSWWAPFTIVAVALSTATFLVTWNGSGQRLADQGGVAILINLALLILALTL